MNRIICLFCFVTILLITGCTYVEKGPSPFTPIRPATGKRVFIFDPSYGGWAAYDEKGNIVKTGRAVGGRDFCPDLGRPCRTVTGTFKILTKGDEECKSSRFPLDTKGGAPMPYCMHFHKKGYAIHGVDPLPDTNSSHGCIGVSVSDAQWLNNYFMRMGSTVIVRPYHYTDSE